MKECNSCKKIKGSECYGKDKRNKNGIQGICNYCKNEKRALRYLLDIDYKNKQKENQKKYAIKARERANKHVKELSEFYIIASLKRHTDLTTEDIKKFPKLIECKKQILINKRLCKTLKTLKS
tara:strand:+ start:28934 stop:29302 length:369 start_codon:yes stop_codon:yes gene_type:complete